MKDCPGTEFYSRPTAEVAKSLIGTILVRKIKIRGKSVRLSGRIIETEAYGHSDDPASHARMGPTARNGVMFGDVGRAYVYFIYGNHFCVNVSARSGNEKAGAVLIRALEPIHGIEIMNKMRGVSDPMLVTSGPGRLTQALDITSLQNGVDMTSPDSELHIECGVRADHVMATPRIGITRSAERYWRFVDPTSKYLSRKLQIKV
ncbi:MAG TPA: DNA-3-methyladenine glycosylase [Nitrososphaera sp.]